MYRCIPGFVHSGITRFKLGCLRTSLLTVLHVVYAIGRGLAQARPWFRSSMWISSVGGISKYSEQVFIWHTTVTVLLVGTLPEGVTSINSPNYSCTLIGSRL